jgi:hypothetical protein
MVSSEWRISIRNRRKGKRGKELPSLNSPSSFTASCAFVMLSCAILFSASSSASLASEGISAIVCFADSRASLALAVTPDTTSPTAFLAESIVLAAMSVKVESQPSSLITSSSFIVGSSLTASTKSSAQMIREA